MLSALHNRHVRPIWPADSYRVGNSARLRAKAPWVAILAVLLLMVAGSSAGAQDHYPTRLVRIVVPFPAGGTADILPRIVADRLSARWHQPVIVENRGGAGGNIGAEIVAGSPPDGYVLLACPPGPIAINDHLYQKLSFQPSKFEPVIVLGSVPNVLVVKPTFPAGTAQELIAHLKANPGKVTFASQGNGSTSHLSAMLFQKLTGTHMLHVPYRGTAPALQDIIGNHVDVFFDNLGSSLAPHNAGSLRIIAVGSTERVPVLPNIPTLQEVGLTGFASITWFAVMAPPGTATALTEAINKDISEILGLPDVRDQFAKMGVQPMGGSVPEMKKFIADERALWGDVIRATNIQLD
jgi:tripartite-type tricarboxylate transporter receptor subunit TctC